MKIFYLSTTSFADCELELLNKLGRQHEVKYGVIIPQKNNNYTEAELRACINDKAVSLWPIQLKYRFRDLRQNLSYIRVLRGIRKFNPDVIYINFFHDPYFNLLIIPFLKKSKTIIGLHDVVHHSGTKNSSLLAVIQKLLLRKFVNILSFSASQADLLRKDYPSHNIFTIPLMLKNFGEVEAKSKDYTRINFLFFGNILPYKGLKILLQAADNLRAGFDNFTITIAGRCTDWATAYAPMIADKDHVSQHIRFIKNEEIPEFYTAAHYLVLPYKDVTQSGPLMIAYNYNVPVICSDINGFREYVDEGETGFLFDPANTGALCKVMEKALLRKEAEYQKLVENIMQYKRSHFDAGKIAGKYASLFHTVATGALNTVKEISSNQNLSGSIA